MVRIWLGITVLLVAGVGLACFGIERAYLHDAGASIDHASEDITEMHADLARGDTKAFDAAHARATAHLQDANDSLAALAPWAQASSTLGIVAATLGVVNVLLWWVDRRARRRKPTTLAQEGPPAW